MPGNLYGVSQPGVFPAVAFGGDVACPAATDTVILTSPVVLASSSGYYFPLLLGQLVFLCGAAAPTAFSIKARVQGQAAFATSAVAPGLMVNNGTFIMPYTTFGNASGTAFWPSGSIIEIVANPTTNALTFKGVGSLVIIALFHGPDL